MDTIARIIEPKNCREAAALRALDRAYARQAHSRFVDVRAAGERVTARYASDTGASYTVTVTPGWTACTCEAGRHDRYCYHVLALADRAGMLDALVYGFYRRLSETSTTAIAPIAAARAEVDRLASFAKTTSDFHRLQNARAQLAALTEARELVAA